MLDFYRFTHFQKCPSILHAVSKKSAIRPYVFSLALHTGEDAKKIVSNRALIANALSSDKTLHFIVANQTHSEHIKIIRDTKTQGWIEHKDAIEDCDALISNVSAVVLGILTADCVPTLLYDKEKQVVAAIHAGWKGTKEEITFKTVQKMKLHFGCDAKNIIAGIAPSIGSCCYEVSEEVAKHFYSYPKSLMIRGDKYMLDLPYINQKQLINAGLEKKNIEMSEICTSCEVRDYFSYRKENGCSGRFISMIGLK